MRIRFEQPYIPADGPEKIARLWREVEWSGVPAIGDFVHYGDGPGAAKVDHIYWEATGRALVHLHGNPHDGPRFSEVEIEAFKNFGWGRAPG